MSAASLSLHRTWPPAAEAAQATRVQTRIAIDCDALALYRYVTNPSRWREWHPATAAVTVPRDEPMRRGEYWVEHIRAFGRRDAVTWTVLAGEPGRLWVIGGLAAGGVARITYRLQPTAGGCVFARTLEFRSRSPGWRFLDGNLLRWALARQSRRALVNLKRQAEFLLPRHAVRRQAPAGTPTQG